MNVRRIHLMTILMTWTLCVPVVSSTPTQGAPKSARQQVRTGLQKHAAGDFAGAAEAFAQAAVELPGDHRVAYDRACALARQGERAEATELFQQAATSRDPPLVADSHYNLGCLVAQEAKDLFGAQQEEAQTETREQGLKLMEQAVRHYRDSLRADASHAAARRNLELLRLWVKHIQDVWAQRDRERRREEMDLWQFLEWIDSEQRTLEAATKALGQDDSSPRQRQAVAQAEQAQRRLAEEISPLQQKLAAAVRGPTEGTQADPASMDAVQEQALQTLSQMTQQIERAMLRAADELVVRALPTSLAEQAHAIEGLNDIYRAAGPYELVLAKATQVEQTLVETTSQVLSDEAWDDTSVARELVARDQRFVSTWSETLPAKAQQGLAMLESAAPPTEIGPPTEAQQDQQQQHREALRASYEKAVQLAPQVVELTQAATADLEAGRWSEAHPKQEEALRLLREMAPPPDPKQDQQDNQPKDPPQDEPKDDPKQDQQSPPDAGDSEKPPEPQQENQQPSEQQEQQQQQQRQDLSRQQAEAILSKVRQREREHREREQALRRLLQGTFRVDRDW